MKALKILTTAAVAGALVATAVAGPASAATDTAVTSQPVITTNVTAPIVVPAYTASAPILVNTTAADHTNIEAWITYNGALFDAGAVYEDAAGNATFDVLQQISYKVAGYGDPLPGNYGVYFTSAQDVDTEYSSDYTTSTTTTYLAAQSATFGVTVTKLQSKVTGFKTKTRVAHYSSSKRFLTVGKPTVLNAGVSGKAYLQYKTSKKGKWHTATNSSAVIFSSGAYKYKLNYQKFNSLKKGKIVKRGTYYLRIKIKSSDYVTGAVSKQVKIVVK